MGLHLLGGLLIQNMTFRPCIANNPYPALPEGREHYCGAALGCAWGWGVGVGCRLVMNQNRIFGSDIANNPSATEPWILGAAWTPARGHFVPLAGDTNNYFLSPNSDVSPGK